jgi:hypothetical protein
MQDVNQYLKSNPIVEKFIAELNQTINEYYQQHLPGLAREPVSVTIGAKFIAISHNGARWGFISRFDGVFKGAPIRKGDLLKAATWAQPAKHSRGNIADGTARYSVYGPDYLR